MTICLGLSVCFCLTLCISHFLWVASVYQCLLSIEASLLTVCILQKLFAMLLFQCYVMPHDLQRLSIVVGHKHNKYNKDLLSARQRKRKKYVCVCVCVRKVRERDIEIKMCLDNRICFHISTSKNNHTA